MLFGDQDVMLFTATDDMVAAGEWTEELEEQARSIGGYLVVINSNPARIVADYRPIGVPYEDAMLILDLLETALQEPGFFDERVEAEARPMTEKLHSDLRELVSSGDHTAGSLTIRMATEPAVLDMYSAEVIGEYTDDDERAYILLRFPAMRRAAQWAEATGLGHRVTVYNSDNAETTFNDLAVIRIALP